MSPPRKDGLAIPVSPEAIAMADHVGARIRQLRGLADMTPQDLADQLRAHRSQLYKWESGGYPNLPLSRMVDIAMALKVPVTDFFIGSPLGDPKGPRGGINASTMEMVSLFRQMTRGDRDLIKGLMRSLLQKRRPIMRHAAANDTTNGSE